MDEFRLNKLGLGVSAQNLRALGDDGGPSASASTSEVREANEQDEFILGVADLDIVGVIGTGSGGVVRLAKHKRTDEALAVKNIAISLARDDDGRKRIITELRTLHKSSCEYIVRSLGAFFDQGSVGEVADEDNLDKYTVNIREFNAYVSKDKRVEQIIVPLGDGMTVCRVL